MKRTPLQEVKERFGSKENLVAEVAKLVRPREDESESELQERLTTTPNSKLLHLHAVETQVKDRFGSREKLADAICKLRFGDKKVDQDYRNGLLTKSSATLMDLHRSHSRR